MESEDLFQNAYDYLDRNDFCAARESYRQAILVTEPDDGQLGNLGIAEIEETLQFRRTMCSHHPQSLRCRINLIHTLQSAGHSGQAVQVASACLSEFQCNESDFNRIRFARLQSAIAAGNQDIVFEDFTALWNTHSSRDSESRFHLGILMCVLTVRLPAFAPLIEQMAMLPFVTGESRDLLLCKAQELRHLTKLRQAT